MNYYDPITGYYYQQQPLSQQYDSYYDNPATPYDPVLFGYPYNLASPQSTEAFQHQLPDWAQVETQRPLRYYPGVDFVTHPLDPHYDAMDGRTVLIGSAHNRKQSEKNNGNGPKRNPITKPKETVDVYVGETFVQQVPLRLLTRFSRAAAAVFPRQQNDNKTNTGGVLTGEKKQWADGEDDGNLDVKQLAAQVEKLPPITGKAVQHPVIDKGVSGGVETDVQSAESSKTAQARADEEPVAKKATAPNQNVFILGFEGKEPPLPAAVRNCLDWMNLNKFVHGNEKLADFHVPEQASLKKLINIYVATLSLELRPFPNHLQRILFEFVTQIPTTADELQYIKQRLPPCALLTRVFTSCIDHEAQGSYDADELKKLQEAVAADSYLFGRFRGIRSKRSQEAKQAGAKKSMQETWNALDAEIDAEGGGPSAGASREFERSTAVNGQGGGRRTQHPRRQQEGKGKVTADTESKEKRGATAKGSAKGKAEQTATPKPAEEPKPKADRWLEAERKAAENAKKSGGGKGDGGASTSSA